MHLWGWGGCSNVADGEVMKTGEEREEKEERTGIIVRCMHIGIYSVCLKMFRAAGIFGPK
jgi:hypothetical protein